MNIYKHLFCTKRQTGSVLQRENICTGYILIRKELNGICILNLSSKPQEKESIWKKKKKRHLLRDIAVYLNDTHLGTKATFHVPSSGIGSWGAPALLSCLILRGSASVCSAGDRLMCPCPNNVRRSCGTTFLPANVSVTISRTLVLVPKWLSDDSWV